MASFNSAGVGYQPITWSDDEILNRRLGIVADGANVELTGETIIGWQFLVGVNEPLAVRCEPVEVVAVGELVFLQ